MNWKTVFIIISMGLLALASFGIGAKWDIFLFPAGVFFFVATFINIQRTP